MPNVYDLAYASLLAAAAPYWLVAPKARRKVLRALKERMGSVPQRDPARPAVMIHAVSLGEVNATRALIERLGAARPDLDFIVSTTTDTGYARARQLFGSNERLTIIRFPLDFTLALHRVLERLRPKLIVLMELEVWPNLLRQCEKAGVPVALVNGRLTESSFRHYRWGGAVTRRMFSRLAAVCAQDELYAARFRLLGAPADRVRVTGTMKFDTAEVATHIDGAAELAGAVGLRPGHEPIWVCGSTGPGEEEIILDVHRRLREKRPLRLVIVPRHPERFDAVAELIQSRGFSVVRRSGSPVAPDEVVSSDAVVLGDTMGELRKFYSLADVVLVGRSLVDLGPRQHGSDMIEPAALAKPVAVGPFTRNFADAMGKFLAAGAMREVNTPQELEATIAGWLDNPAAAAELGRQAQDVVRAEQGATDRHARLILDQLQALIGAEVTTQFSTEL